MSQPFRRETGGRIDRSKSVSFKFNGKTYQGYAGDTVASALLANGVRVVGRSFKYHRPRGIVSSGAEEPNALLQVEGKQRTTPNLRATQTEIYDGLKVSSVNVWPLLEFDIGSLANITSPILPAGFYYKTFMFPRKGWKVYEKFIRKSAGFGVAGRATGRDLNRDKSRYDKLNVWCDVLVAGGGPAGLATAVSAARHGARVIIADQNSELGGGLLRSSEPQHQSWLAKVVSELNEYPRVRVLTRSVVAGYYDSNFLVINERVSDHLTEKPENTARERLWRVRANRVILATGAIERPIVFKNNDLPGIMLASAVSDYIHRFAVSPGKQAVFFTNNNSAYATALDILDAGMKLDTIIEARDHAPPKMQQELTDRGVTILTGSAVIDALGSRKIKAVKVAKLDHAGRIDANPTAEHPCDLLAVSGGWSPVVHLHAQSGAKPVFDEDKACFVPGNSVQLEQSVGAANGQFDLNQAIQAGFEAGQEAAVSAGYSNPPNVKYESLENSLQLDYQVQPIWLVPCLDSKFGSKRFVDFQNDTTAEDIFLAASEGYKSIEHVKRYTLLGFGTDQGKLGNVNGMSILAAALEQDIAQTGTTTFRPPYTPVTFGTIAGRELGSEFFDPVRRTPMHQWHQENGAEFENVGQWKRPWYYPKSGESMQQAVNRECLAARNSVAVLDASTLGKIEVYGPDSTKFLDYVYTNAWSSLAAGYCRYGIMLGEDGMVMDDGVTAKLADDHYYMTTTTGGAAHVLQWMELWRQTEWPDMKVFFTSVTEHWAVISLAGPNSRNVLKKVAPELAVSNEEFPFMSFRHCQVVGIDARIFRISFTGELSYEINVPANHGEHVWREVMEAGREFGITPYGTETMHVLRAEKGFIIVGQDTDGSMTPIDMGMKWIVSKHKDCLGKRSLTRIDCARGDRKQFVGLLTEDPKTVLPEGAQLVEEPSDRYPLAMIGHVTSSYWSATLERSIALAVVKGGHSRMGQRIFAIPLSGDAIEVSVTRPLFYDAEGARQNV